MQTLFVKTANGGQRDVKIIRAWLDASGKSVYLHASGRYAYKDGSPLKSASELSIIGDTAQRAQAQAWWTRAGEQESKKYYADLEARQVEAAGDFRETPADMSELDAVLYVRKRAQKGSTMFTAPHAWMEWFDKRPDWWGQAKQIDFPDFTYRMAEAIKSQNPAPPPEAPADAPKASAEEF